MKRREACRTRQGGKNRPYPPPPLPQARAWMLLKIKERTRNGSDHPTMFMIISGLVANFAKAVFYFQYDSLWKKMKMAANRARTHDVCDQKGVSSQSGKSRPMFSIGYRHEGDANGFVEPTMCMAAKDLGENRQFSRPAYVVENRTRSSLAAENEGFGTHDVYEADSLSSRLCFAGLSPPSPLCSLYVASC